MSIVHSNQTFIKSFLKNQPIEDFVELPASGSERRNFIFKANGQKYVLTENENVSENESFFYFSDVFSNLKLNTPKIFKISEDKKSYIQEYLGEKTLSQLISEKDSNVEYLVEKTLFKLIDLQSKTQGKIDFSRTFEYRAYNHIPILHDLFYFKFMFVDVLEISYNKQKLIEEFHEIVQLIENISPKGLMLRDFQSRNIMVNNEEVYFIDYQSAMQGPLMYDVISFLNQAKANFSEAFKAKMLESYIQLHQDINVQKQLRDSILPLRLMRNLQVLGAYGFRGLIQRKEHFIQSIPQGIENLQQTIQEWKEMERFTELKTIIEKLK